MRIVDFPQGTDEWRAARAGKVTASRMCDVLAKIKTGEAAARRDYRAQLVAEILTGQPQDDGYINKEMQWGIDHEPLARAAYELANDCYVDKVGFVLHPTLHRAGCSPDGLVGTDGMVEIKCPKTATHLQYLMDGCAPREHLPQMHWGLACCERKWVDFISFDPRLPERLRLFKVRVMRDDELIKEYEREVWRLLAEVDKQIATIKAFGA